MTADLVTLTIDGKTLQVAKGTNLIEAAKQAGVDVPYYCYHPHLSIAGNCRMCQVEVKGRPKLEIGCNTMVQEGMEVLTQVTSERVKDAQAATLEFILINHPLDCTVCDQAGHCKLQDYHYDYNAKSSRFLEEKEHKVKAEPLGPTVVLDGERCIMCTRCIRFCDEVTKTSELGMLNRGDRAVIAINPDRPLDNALSGTVVDLCPVGALTHRNWRFNTRIWFTKETDAICPGCSTGCNVKVAVRDREVVQVKARLNGEVNKEWLCDEGRYGFDRFLPEKRFINARVAGSDVSLEKALDVAKASKGDDLVVVVSPNLTTEEFWVLKQFLGVHFPNNWVGVRYKERNLSQVESILVSPDYSANYRGAQFVGLIGDNPGAAYQDCLNRIRSGSPAAVLLVGQGAILEEDLTPDIQAALKKVPKSIAIITDELSLLAQCVNVVLAGRSPLEKSGLLLNRKGRIQYSQAAMDQIDGTNPEWRLLASLADKMGKLITSASSDRELTLALLENEPRLAGIKISDIKRGGIQILD